MMTFGLVVEQGTLGILRNTPLVRQLGQLPAHQLVYLNLKLFLFADTN